MIIQCDQCKTRFRLDDSRVTVSGVRVRCSRCKHTFVVRREASEEEADARKFMEELEKGSSETRSPREDTGWDVAERETAVPGSGEEETKGDAARDSGGIFAPKDTGDEGRREEGVSFPLSGVGGVSGQDDSEGNSEVEGDGDFFSTPDSDRQAAGYGDRGEGEGGAAEGPRENSGDSQKIDFGSEPPESSPVREFETGFPFDPGRGERGEGQSWDIFPSSADAGGGKQNRTGEATISAGEGPDVGRERLFETASRLSGAVEDVASSDFSGEFEAAGAAEGTATTDQERGLREVFGFSKDSVGGRVAWAGREAADEDLPPLAISSRRKRSFPGVFAGLLLLLLVLVAVSFYHFRDTISASLKTPAESLQSGQVAPVQGQKPEITIKNLEGAFVRNNTDGEIFIVRGEAFNESTRVHSSVNVRGYVYGDKGEVLMNKAAYFGRSLTDDQAANLPLNEIESFLQAGTDDAAETVVLNPGTGVPFVVVFSDIPANAGEFGAEAVNSAAP